MRKKVSYGLLGAGVSLMLGACSGQAAVLTVEAVDDNYIRGGTHASTVQGAGGSSDFFELRGDGSVENIRKDYVRFDLAGLNPDPNASATFSFAVLSGSGGGSGTSVAVWALNSGAPGFSWSESTLNWNNAPAHPGPNANEFTADATKLIRSLWIPYSTAAGTAQNVTIPLLGDYLQADQSVTIMMGAGRNTSDSLLTGRLMNAASSEHGTYDGPQLQFSQVPEPSALVLAAFGMVALFSFRRRSTVNR